tara:strand:+ start:1045 stop:1269 length:225 start_codon:yes stop_codon:yes gene_type:complete
MNFIDLINNFEKLSCDEKNEMKKQININWKQILPNLKIPEHILELFADQIDIVDIIKYQNVSKEFIAKFQGISE